MLESKTESIGKVIGFLFPNKLVFVTKNRLNIGDYVFVRDEIDGKLRIVLARINDLVFSDLEATARAFATPSSVIYSLIEPRASPYEMYVVAQCEVLGVGSDENILQPLRTPVKPGLDVQLATPQVLQPIFTPRTKSLVEVGQLPSRKDVKVFADAESFCEHILIAGETGTGKSQLAMQIAIRTQDNRFSVIAFDLSGEWRNLATPARNINYFSSEEVKINFPLLSTDELNQLIGASFREERILKRFHSPGHFDSVDTLLRILTTYEASRIESPDVESLATKLERLKDLEVFGHSKFSARDSVRSATISIIDISQITWDSTLFLGSVIREITKDPLQLQNPQPTLLIIDDADLIFSRSEESEFVSEFGNTLRTLTKLRVGVCLALQQPSIVPLKVRSLFRTAFVFKMVNQRDLDAMWQLTDTQTETVKRLPPFECLGVGAAIPIPTNIETTRVL